MSRACRVQGSRLNANNWTRSAEGCSLIVMERERQEPIMRGIQAGRASTPAAYTAAARETCMADGCHASTNGGKPYCLDHIEQMPYVTGNDDLPINI